jgi:hypothetical protein
VTVVGVDEQDEPVEPLDGEGWQGDDFDHHQEENYHQE